jgi:hypothetical protein
VVTIECEKQTDAYSYTMDMLAPGQSITHYTKNVIENPDGS